MLEIVPFTLGPVQTNAYLVADPETKEAAVIDPAWDGEVILAEAQKRGWRIAHLWYTHAHFDHIGGAAAIADALNPLPLVALHPADHDLWQAGGGGPMFGFQSTPAPNRPSTLRTVKSCGWETIPLKCATRPGHTPGHVVFYCAQAKICFCGDLIFAVRSAAPTCPAEIGRRSLRASGNRFISLPEKPASCPVTARRRPWARRKFQSVCAGILTKLDQIVKHFHSQNV